MGLGIGCGFSLSMALPLDVAADGASVAATTGLMLLVAYVIAAASPVGLGAIRDLTGGYAAVLWVLAGTAAGAVALGATLSPDWLHRAPGQARESPSWSPCRWEPRTFREHSGAPRRAIGRSSQSRSRSRSSTPRSTALEVGAGTRLLDAGCGAGSRSPSRLARGAAVAGLDASAALLEIARERLARGRPASGRPRGAALRGGSFDAVTAFNSVQYAGDPAAALREIRRVVGAGRAGRGRDLGPPGAVRDARRPGRRRLAAAAAPRAAPAGRSRSPHPGALEAAGRERRARSPERAIDVPTPYAHPDLDTAVRARLASGPAQPSHRAAGFAATPRGDRPRLRTRAATGRLGHVRRTSSRCWSRARERRAARSGQAASPGCSSGCEASLNSPARR